ncbi:putative c6 zinc finger domain-containing protein [Diplodia seriata]|uniref:Putative c6 zinc finger domain-containing protein n=1 Tax=Diplodia seriata TaxID=420778 RepID=A0A0G2DR83_9PEZI|nr:putative c6 zinc finger domain-containing protein [Diplodia seriata]
MMLLSELPRSATPTPSTALIPATFRSLDEFERHWTLSRRSQARMASIMADTMQASGGAPPGSLDDAALARFYDGLLSNARIRDFCADARREMRALDAAFAPLFDAVVADAEPGDPAYLKALHLRLQYLGVVLFEDPPQYACVETVRARTPVFREYVSLAATALGAAARQGRQQSGERRANPAAQLSLQCGVAFNLCLLALFCRDPLVRDQAVALLEGYPGQDGLWNTRALHALAARNRVVERANAVEGTDEERWRRLWRREMVFEEAGERVLLRYLDRDAESGEWRLVEEVGEVRAREEQVCWRRQPLTGSGAPLLADLYAFYSD